MALAGCKRHPSVPRSVSFGGPDWPPAVAVLLEQFEDRLTRLRGERQRGGRELLPGLQCEQVGAVEPEVAVELADLAADRIELRGKTRADRHVGRLLRLAGKSLRRLHQLGDRGEAVVRGQDRIDAA